MGYGLGIDLGTTFTAAAVDRAGHVEMVSLGDRTAAIPSVVLLRADGGVLVGDAASRRAAVEPDRVAREFKRRLGDVRSFLFTRLVSALEELREADESFSGNRHHEAHHDLAVVALTVGLWGDLFENQFAAAALKELKSQVFRFVVFGFHGLNFLLS